MGASGDWRRGHGQFRGGGDLLFFHLNGIAGDPYKTLTLAFTGTTFPLVAMATLCVLKLAATVTSYSSGGAGGILLLRSSWAACWAARWATSM